MLSLIVQLFFSQEVKTSLGFIKKKGGVRWVWWNCDYGEGIRSTAMSVAGAPRCRLGLEAGRG